VKDQLGHSSIQVTVDIYGRWLPSGDRGWAAKLDLVTASNQNQRFAQAGIADARKTGSS